MSFSGEMWPSFPTTYKKDMAEKNPTIIPIPPLLGVADLWEDRRLGISTMPIRIIRRVTKRAISTVPSPINQMSGVKSASWIILILSQFKNDIPFFFCDGHHGESRLADEGHVFKGRG